MSNPRAKAERSKAKDIRQGIEEQTPVSSKKQKKKKYAIICDMTFLGTVRKEQTYGKYERLKDAENAFKVLPLYCINATIEEI